MLEEINIYHPHAQFEVSANLRMENAEKFFTYKGLDLRGVAVCATFIAFLSHAVAADKAFSTMIGLVCATIPFEQYLKYIDYKDNIVVRKECVKDGFVCAAVTGAFLAYGLTPSSSLSVWNIFKL